MLCKFELTFLPNGQHGELFDLKNTSENAKVLYIFLETKTSIYFSVVYEALILSYIGVVSEVYRNFSNLVLLFSLLLKTSRPKLLFHSRTQSLKAKVYRLLIASFRLVSDRLIFFLFSCFIL